MNTARRESATTTTANIPPQSPLAKKPSAIPPPPPPPPPPPTSAKALPRPKARIRTTPSLEPVPESDPKAAPSLDDGLQPKKTYNNNKMPLPSKKRSQYFHETLHERNQSPAADVVRGQAMVMAEVKTNVKIKNEFQFIGNLSEHLAARYSRPVASIVVILHHSQCMLFGGSAQPAYVMSISALPAEVQTATNKRNTVVMQSYMESALLVPPARGLVRFVPVADECLGWGGKTVAGQIAEATGHATPEPDEGRAQDRRTALKSLSLRRPAPSLTPPSTQPPTPARNDTQRSQHSTRPRSTSTPAVAAASGDQQDRAVRKKKSIIHTFFRSASKHGSGAPILPPTDEGLVEPA